MSLRQAAAYLGVSYWSVRDYALAGLLPVVELPALRPREGERARRSLRRVLFDRQDLDAFVEAHRKHTGSIEPMFTGSDSTRRGLRITRAGGR